MGPVSVGLLFHDIGKSRVDGAILKKEGPLNPSEWETIKRHPAWGRDILVENGIRIPPSWTSPSRTTKGWKARVIRMG